MSTVDRHVFISYCRADAAWLDRLKIHLRPLVRRTALEVWDDSRISPGQTWHEEISNALARARVAVLLISADFLASEFIVNNELPPLLHRAARGGLLMVPLMVSPCLFAGHEELSRYQSVNRPDRPLSGMSRTDAEAALVSLGRSVDQYFRRLDTSSQPLEVPLDRAIPPAKERRATDPTARPASTSTPTRHSWSKFGPLVVERPSTWVSDGAAPDGIPVGWFNSWARLGSVN